MKISDVPAEKGSAISAEFFPPKIEPEERILFKVIEK